MILAAVPGGAPFIAAAALSRQRRIVDQLTQQRAFDPKSASTLLLTTPLERGQLNALKRRSIVREAGPGRYYLDRPAWEEFVQKRRLVLSVVMLAIMVALLVLLMVRS